MPKYRINKYYLMTYKDVYEVEAKSKEEALDMSYDEFDLPDPVEEQVYVPAEKAFQFIDYQGDGDSNDGYEVITLKGKK